VGGTWKPPAPLVAALSSPQEPPRCSSPPGQTRLESERECTERCKDPEPRSRSPPHQRTPLGAHNPSVEMVSPHVCPPAARNTWLLSCGGTPNRQSPKTSVQRRGLPQRAVWKLSCARDYLETACAPLAVLSAPRRTRQPRLASPLPQHSGLLVPGSNEVLERPSFKAIYDEILPLNLS